MPLSRSPQPPSGAASGVDVTDRSRASTSSPRSSTEVVHPRQEPPLVLNQISIRSGLSSHWISSSSTTCCRTERATA
ncbi:pollen-specific leucine-rich repeat extensin-like protein 3 [Iris pallida]|uniref:Pollen-specific leucine-rich repeat extensin-like protein 3 n=1 Tax=Iris pallida TaxID=29817 RepID=A0AAX6DKB2_IRIPA|nr:pollen-specific leucine-rich repeat extensin-like protein 3 [Iris pallida]KAJ6792194.1 pollen-specific leucine-rich repeat extensin-like protein 3 [Iris pallida]